MLTAGGISGAEMRHVAGNLRKAAARDLNKELRGAQRKAAKPLQAEIKTEAAASLPKRGGYAAVMSKAVKVSPTQRGATLRLRVHARGKVEPRDVRAVNDGILRHPHYGDRLRWFVTRVRPGFVDRPADELVDRVLAESADAAARVLAQIART